MKLKGNFFYRNLWLFLLIVLFLFVSCQPKVYKVGILSGADSLIAVSEGFIGKMTELGYVEGKNIAYDIQKVNPGKNLEKPAVEKFIADKVDLVFVYPSGASEITIAALQEKIPMIFAIGVVEGTKMIKSIREPGGNLTGVRAPIPENTSKSLEIMHEIVPDAKRYYLACNRSYPTVPAMVDKLYETAKTLGVTIVEVPVKTPDDIKADLAARSKLKDIGVDVMFIISESNNTSASKEMLAFGVEHKIPIRGTLLPMLKSGALFSLSTDMNQYGILAAPLADKILKGTPAGTIPVVSPEDGLHINYKTAQELNITIPDSILSTAVEVIK